MAGKPREESIVTQPLSPEDQAIAHLANATLNAFVILNKCLLNNGSLRVGQFSNALKETVNYPGAESNRLDYTHMRMLAEMLDRAEAEDRTRSDGELH
jgi:hypothetical protein